MSQTIYLRGKPIVQRYTPSGQVNSGDVIVIGNRPVIAVSNDPDTTQQGTAVVTYQVDAVAVSGGIYRMLADAAYPNGTYVYWNPTTLMVTASPTAGGQCVPLGWIVGGPADDMSDGGPTGAGTACSVEHDPTDDTGQILGCAAVSGDVITNTTNTTAFATSVTIPAGTLVVGDTIHVHAAGAVTGQSPNTVTNDIVLQILTAANTNTALLNTGAVNAAANTAFVLDGDIVFTAVGNTGTFNFIGEYSFGTSAVRVNKAVINTAINTNLGVAISVTDTQNAAGTGNTTQLVELVVQKVRR